MPTSIEFHHLHLVKQIANTGNMTLAAKQLFLTQPSLSYQLKEIESKLGLQLFLRINKKLVLTEAGQTLLHLADEVLPMIDSAEKRIKKAGQAAQKEIRISTECYTGYHWLPTLLKKFMDKHPQAEIDIVTEAMENPVAYLLNGKIDIALVNERSTQRGVIFKKLFDDEQVLLVHKDHPLATREFIKPKDFESENFIMYKEAFDKNSFASKILIPAGVQPKRITRMQLTEARVELVKANMGITVLSRWFAKPFMDRSNSIRLIKIGKSGFYRSWYMTLLSGQKETSHIREFSEYLVDALHK